MKPWLLSIVLLVTACILPGAPPNDLRLDELRGQWVVINYWAIGASPVSRKFPN